MDEAKHYKFVQNRQCEFFPCHKGVAEEDFNCLFCYCPLYALGQKCGGNCRYTEQGYKDCEKCAFPHQRANFDAVISRYREIMKVVALYDRTNE